MQLSMFDGPLMLWVNLPVVDTIHSKENKFVTSVKIKVTRNLLTALTVEDPLNIDLWTFFVHQICD